MLRSHTGRSRLRALRSCPCHRGTRPRAGPPAAPSQIAATMVRPLQRRFQAEHWPARDCSRISFSRPLEERRRVWGGCAMMLPKMHALIGRQVVFLPRFHAECSVPLVLVASGPDGTEPRRAMLVRKHLLPERSFAKFRAPDLPEGQIEALVTCEAVDNRRGLAVERDRSEERRVGKEC